MNKGYQQFFIENLDDVFNKHHQDFFVSNYELKEAFKILFYWDLIADTILTSIFINNTFTIEQKRKVFQEHISLHFHKIKSVKGKYLTYKLKSLKNKSKSLIKEHYYCDVIYYVSSVSQLKNFQYLIPVFIEKKLKIKYIYSGKDQEILKLIDQKDIINTNDFHPKFIANSFSRKYPYFTEIFLKLEQCILRSKCKIIIVSEGDAIPHKMLDEIAKKNQIKSVCLQWGYFGTEIPKLGWQNMQYDAFLCWGQYFKDGFEEFNKKLKIYNVGHHFIEKSKVYYKDRPTVLVALQQPLRPFIDKKDTIKFLDSILLYASRNIDVDFVIRSHPSAPVEFEYLNKFSQFNNIIFHDSKKINLNESLNGTWFCISICSTLTLEAIAKGVVPLYYSLKGKEFYAQKQLLNFDSKLIIKDITQIDLLVKEFNQLKNNISKNSFYSALGPDSILKINEVFSHIL